MNVLHPQDLKSESVIIASLPDEMTCLRIGHEGSFGSIKLKKYGVTATVSFVSAIRRP